MIELETASFIRSVRAAWVFAVAILWGSPPALAADDSAHYEIDARFAESGQLTASVDIVLPGAEVGAETVLLLNERFN